MHLLLSVLCAVLKPPNVHDSYFFLPSSPFSATLSYSSNLLIHIYIIDTLDTSYFLKDTRAALAATSLFSSAFLAETFSESHF